MERGNTVYSIPIRFLKTGKFIVTDCSLESRKIHMEKVCLVPSEQLRWRVVASCTVSIDIHRATPTFAQTIATIQTLFLDPWKSYQVCWKLKDTTHREIGGSVESEFSQLFFIIHHFQFMSFAFFPLSPHSLENKNWLNWKQENEWIIGFVLFLIFKVKIDPYLFSASFKKVEKKKRPLSVLRLSCNLVFKVTLFIWWVSSLNDDYLQRDFWILSSLLLSLEPPI